MYKNETNEVLKERELKKQIKYKEIYNTLYFLLLIHFDS